MCTPSTTERGSVSSLFNIYFGALGTHLANIFMKHSSWNHLKSLYQKNLIVMFSILRPWSNLVFLQVYSNFIPSLPTTVSESGGELKKRIFLTFAPQKLFLTKATKLQSFVLLALLLLARHYHGHYSANFQLCCRHSQMVLFLFRSSEKKYVVPGDGSKPMYQVIPCSLDQSTKKRKEIEG